MTEVSIDLTDLPTLYTEKQVAKYLGIGIHSVQRLRRCGKLRSVKVGASRRYTPQHVVEYLQQSEELCRKEAGSGGSSCRNRTPSTRAIASAGSIPLNDRRLALQLARRIASGRKKRS